MHEFEWLPGILSKADLLQICHIFNLTIDGFRKEKLFSRPEEQLRRLVSEALRRGIGEKKESKGKIPIHEFYTQIADGILKENPELKNTDIMEFLFQLEYKLNVRPYQKLALLYQVFNNFYNNQLELIQKNAIEKQEIFHGIGYRSENFFDRTIQILKIDDSYPSLEEYEAFIEDCGYREKYEQIKSNIKGMDERTIFAFVVNLQNFERFLAQVALIYSYTDDSRFDQLQSSIYRYFVKEKESQSLEALHQLQHQVKKANDEIESLKKRLDVEVANRSSLIEQMEELLGNFGKMKNELNAKENHIKGLEKQCSINKNRLSELEKIKEIFEELIPVNNQAIIITDVPDTRIKKVFTKNIFSKSYLYNAKRKGDISHIKEKALLIDRLSFTNTREWVELRNFFIENGIYYEEYSDYIELINHYIRLSNNGYVEEFEV
ncbi:cell division protein ZapB [Brevibacillus sp. H7]|uniref:cell division protein ZapB n=1 Tax=Brevibacillus sp. H7 TaxID=3349138 RepID=UPI003810F146